MSIKTMPDKQFDKFINKILELAPKPTKESKSKGSFSNCNNHFYGDRENDAVEEFITAIETYKETEEISDEDALKGMPLLLAGDAALWWKGIQREAKTWQDALALLREYYSPTKAPYQIYMELFEGGQQHSETIDAFLSRKRALLAKLPEGLHDESVEINFIYGFLDSKYRRQIPRSEIKTFKDLLEKGRKIERAD